jgi:hypothetical protein
LTVVLFLFVAMLVALVVGVVAGSRGTPAAHQFGLCCILLGLALWIAAVAVIAAHLGAGVASWTRR